MQLNEYTMNDSRTAFFSNVNRIICMAEFNKADDILNINPASVIPAKSLPSITSKNNKL